MFSRHKLRSLDESSSVEGHIPGSTGTALLIAKARALTQRFKRTFAAIVILPTMISIIYFCFLASDIYVSESRFVVRNANKPMVSGIGVLLQSAGMSGSDEARLVQGFISSRDGLRALESKALARKAWGGPHVNLLNRFDPLGLDSSSEALYLYYQTKISAAYDSGGGITTLRVKAFSGAEAEAINRRLLESAEALVNKLNERSQNDLVRYAENELKKSQMRSREAALALADFRNRAGVIDPERQATVQLQMISKLQDELIATRIQLLQVGTVANRSPQITVLRARIKGLESAINQQMQVVAGGSKSLSDAAVQYQRLQLDRDFADKQLASSLIALQSAREEAGRQRVYVERITQPGLPDAAVEPRRLRGIFATLLLSLIAYGIVQMLLVGMREHQL